MIVTFHLAVYFVYYVWNKYISHHVPDTETTQNDSPRDTSNSQPKNVNNKTDNEASKKEVHDEETKNEPEETKHEPEETKNEPKSGDEGTKGEPKSGDEGTKGEPKSTPVEKETIGEPKSLPINEDNIGGSKSAPSDGKQFNRSENISPKNEKFKNKDIASSNEGEGDCHPCLPCVFSDDEDRGREIIYNVEPEYGCICTDNKIQFFPPVYIQRYMEVERILKERWADSVKKVVDFGCAELSFESRYLKTLYGIEEVVAVDIDTETLENNCCKVSPYPIDFLKKRPTPLTIRVFHGSVAHTHDSLIGADAVIAIELVEHLYPPELECLPFTIFGFIRPKIAIFTTPNSDFNVLMPGLRGFRHLDHKFEWSQQQFEDWGHNLVKRYPAYQVTFKGIGPGPSGTENFGCCSQMATFVKLNESTPISDDEIRVQEGPYTLITETIFPFFKDERTNEEKIRDAAENFIINCKMRSRISDMDKTEIPMKIVMERIKYYDRKKLREILIAKNWEIKTNSNNEEVILFPESEEEEDSEQEYYENITENVETVDNTDLKNPPEAEEDWDVECDVKVDMEILTSPPRDDEDRVCSEDNSGGDHACEHVCVSDEQCYDGEETLNGKSDSFDCTNVENTVSSDKLNFSLCEMCFTSETTVPDVELSDSISPSHKVSDPEKDTNLNFEKSIYETPCNNDFSNHAKSNCDSCDCSLPLGDQTVKGCKRALLMVMDPPKELSRFEVNPQKDDPCYCVTSVSSSCDTSIYATPCCLERHKSNIPKCLSLQQISNCSSPALNTKPDGTCKLDSDQRERFSQSVEGFKSLENDLTCSSTSRIVDSGYLDSYSECNMDMDLTPEQFDDIETESEENEASSHSLSPPPPALQFLRVIDDVQNGDVANNNRDGEGNNLVADMEEEPLEFEARIDEINNEVLNLAPANDAIDFDHDMQSGEPSQNICGDCLPYMSEVSLIIDLTNGDQCASEKSPNHDFSKLKSVFTEKSIDIPVCDSFDKKSLRSTKSDNSISTNHSYSLSPCNSKVNSKEDGPAKCKKPSPRLKVHSSLTTVLDGHSKFSNCSLVHPVEVYQVTGIENNNPPDPKSIAGGSRETDQLESTLSTHDVPSVTSTGLQDGRQSLVSVYQSAESLRDQITENRNESSPFPDWLLHIFVSDDENEAESEDSVLSIWDSDSVEERMDLNYDVQVDARGGGDPQRDTWH